MDIRILISSKTALAIATCLVTLELVFVIVHLIDLLAGTPSQLIHELVNLDLENTVPSLFSSMQLMTVALLLLYLTNKRLALGEFRLLLLSSFFVFTYLSMDESLSLHEKLSRRIKYMDWMPEATRDHGSWIVVYVAVGVLFLLINSRSIVRFYKKFPYQSRFVILGAFGYGLGSVVLESFGFELRNFGSFAAYTYQVISEELLEMIGVTTILYGFLQFCTDDYRNDENPTQTETGS
jgi:hypothetical protein